MSNEQKDWEADLEYESKKDLIELVKHFQCLSLNLKAENEIFRKALKYYAGDKFVGETARRALKEVGE